MIRILLLIVLSSIFNLRVYAQKNFIYNDKPEQLLQDEIKFRQGKILKTEEYFKEGKRDSVYRQWNETDSLVTVGYYKNGKRHGKWRFLQTRIYNYSYLIFTYEKGSVTKMYKYLSRSNNPKSKYLERIIHYEADYYTYKENVMLWHNNHQKSSESISVVKNGKTLESKRKAWYKTGQLGLKGQVINSRYEGHWQWWHKNGQRKKEVWYRQGKKLRQKTYDKAGNLVEDKRF